MLLKGAALLPLLDDPGLRPMTDLDVLVPESARARAMDLLTDAGLRPVAGLSRGWIEWVLMPATPGYGFGTSQHHQINLHWHSLHESRQPGADAELWAGAYRPITMVGVQTRVPDPADQLLHSICHGLRWDLRPTYRWVVDASRLLARPLDFDRLVEQACRRRLTVPAAAGLAYLSAVLGGPIPPSALRALKRRRGSLLERAEWRARLQAPHARGPVARAVLDHQDRVRRVVSPGARMTAVQWLRLLGQDIGAHDSREPARPLAPLGEPIRFRPSGSPERFMAYGFAPPQDGGAWTVGHEARLTLPLAEPLDRGVVVTLRGEPHLGCARPAVSPWCSWPTST